MMGLEHDSCDWRTPEQGLEWDLKLMESIFRQITKQYAKNRHMKETIVPRGRKATQIELIMDNQLVESSSLHFQQQNMTHSYIFDPNQMVTKADVLIQLKTKDHLLEKRPFLRVLYTKLACCSNEKEITSIDHYVKYRLHERTLSFTIVHNHLTQIYHKYIENLDFKQRIQTFKEIAAKTSPWCVRDRKSICKSPSQFYNIHKIPSKPKTLKELEKEVDDVKAYTKVFVNTTFQLVVSRIIDAIETKNKSESIQKRKHSVTSTSTTTSPSVERQRQPRTSGSTVVKGRVNLKRDQEQIEAKRKQLSLQILVPDICQTHKKTSFGDVTASSPSSRVQEELLALMEANGDIRIAQQLLKQTIPQSGFRRVIEHLDNIGGSNDAWATIKLWKTVYRNHTLHAIQRIDHTRSLNQ